MSTHKHFDKICCVVLVLTLILTMLFMNQEAFGVQKESNVMGYENKLFDTSTVHTLNIIIDDWDEFTDNCRSEEYYDCTVVIDDEMYKNVAIRGKGNTSLSQVSSYENDRYSFKIEFDHYDDSNTYYGLDKLCLNNIIQDNTYMKDYLTYQMMTKMGVASPLCSYVYITVNGEDWGLYLAVEGVEDSFLKRNFGNSYGELYKPDSMKMGGGRGNGEQFDMEEFMDDFDFESMDSVKADNSMQGLETDMIKPDNFKKKDSQMPGGSMHNASDDVLLKYIDDEIDSYSNIFDNAKTAISDSDKIRLIKALKKLSEGEELSDTVEIETVIRYFVVHNFVVNFDSYTGSMIHNYYLYEKDGQMQMIPWDYNLAFGGFQSMGGATSLVNYPIDDPVSGGSAEDRPMLAWIFDNEEYTELYHTIFAEFISEYFDSGYFESMYDCVAEMITPYIEKDPTKFCTYEEFEKGISTLKEFCMLRAESISGQLEGSIGATADTQDNSTFINADDLQIDSMGAMGNNMGSMGKPMGGAGKSMGANGNPVGGGRPQMLYDKADNVNEDTRSFPNGKQERTEMNNRFSNADWRLLIVCAGVLSAGLTVVTLFTRRKRK